MPVRMWARLLREADNTSVEVGFNLASRVTSGESRHGSHGCIGVYLTTEDRHITCSNLGSDKLFEQDSLTYIGEANNHQKFSLDKFVLWSWKLVVNFTRI